MEDLKKKISEVLKNLTSQKNIELYKRFLKFLNPLYLLKVWKDNSITVINKVKTSIPILLLIWILFPGQTSGGETLYILSSNIEKTNEGLFTHNGDEFTGGAVNIYERKGSVRSIQYFDDGEYIGITKYQTIARLDTTILVQGNKYRINHTPNSILNQEGYTGYYRGKYIETKVPGYWKDGNLVQNGIAQKFDSEGNVIEEITWVDGEKQEDK